MGFRVWGGGRTTKFGVDAEGGPLGGSGGMGAENNKKIDALRLILRHSGNSFGEGYPRSSLPPPPPIRTPDHNGP